MAEKWRGYKMLHIVFGLLFAFTIILMIYSLRERSIALTLLTAILWLIMALFVLQGIEIPYQLFNSTSGNIETGIQTIQTNLDPLSYLFSGLGTVMFLLTITFLLEGFMDYRKIK